MRTSIKAAIDGMIQQLMGRSIGKYGELVTYVISMVDDVDSWVYRKGFTPIIIKNSSRIDYFPMLKYFMYINI
jgi:hypothetical protein